MKNNSTITFTQLKQILKEATHKKLIGERNDEDPVSLADVPPAIKSYLEDKLHAKLWENDVMDLPYLYVTIPLTPDISRSGKRMTTAILNITERKIERNGWHIIEKFEPDDDCPDYTILISPYRNPHEPSSDEFDRTINKQRKDQADREAAYASMDDGDEDDGDLHDDLLDLVDADPGMKRELAKRRKGTGKVKETGKVRTPRYTIQQYCDMKGLDADKLMAAMKAHWSILSPPLTDRSMFLMSALDTYAERYADEMNADTPTDVQVEESDDSIDFKFINSTLDLIVKTVSDCKMTLQDLYRDARYGKAPATMERRQQVMQAMSDIRNLAHDISQEVK